MRQVTRQREAQADARRWVRRVAARALERLDMPGNLEEVLRKELIEVLPIRLPHALAVADLPLHHQDPFDRMQVAQARHENLVLITHDEKIAAYDVSVLMTRGQDWWCPRVSIPRGCWRGGALMSAVNHIIGVAP